MKSNKGIRTVGHDHNAGDTVRKAVKLPPIKKSGKERHELYSSIEEDDDMAIGYRRRESVLDYFDDVEGDDDQTEDFAGDEWEDEEYEEEEE